jgi:hypothetical protein
MLDGEMSVENDSTAYTFHIKEDKSSTFMKGSNDSGDFKARFNDYAGRKQSIYRNKTKIAELRKRGIIPSTYQIVDNDRVTGKITLGFFSGKGNWVINSQKCGTLKKNRYAWILDLEESSEELLFMSCLIAINESKD